MQRLIIYKRLFDIQTIIIKIIAAIFIIILMISAGKNFDENPIFIGICMLVGLLVLMAMAKTEILLLSSNGLIFRTNYWIFKNKDELIKYGFIKEIIHTEDYTIEKDLAAKMLPGHQNFEPNKLYIKLKDETLKEFRFYVFKEQLREFVAKGNELIK